MVHILGRLKERREGLMEEKEKASPACKGGNRSTACLERPKVADQVTDGQWSLFFYLPVLCICSLSAVWLCVSRLEAEALRFHKW